MFNALNLGSLIYILDKTDLPTLRIGTVTSISAPRTNYNQSLNIQNTPVIDIKCLVNGSNLEYNSIPSTYSLVSYNNGKIVLSETKLGLQSEVEGLLQSSRAIVNNIDLYKLNIIDCENILKELNPLFAKDKERDDRLDSLEDKLLKLITLLGNDNNKNI